MKARWVVAFVLGASVGVLGTILMRPAPTGLKSMQAQLLAHPEFLADQPEILERVRAVLLTRKLAAEGQQRVALMRGKWQFLQSLAFTPTLGPPDAKQVLVEFTDYTCVPCRASAPNVREAVAERKNLRVAIMLFPTGGALAEYAARIAVAAYRQNPERFAELHTRLMEQGGELTQTSILSAVRDLRFDVDQLERESQSAEIRRYLEQVRSFSEDLQISGVPAFALNDKLVMGGVGAPQISQLLGAL